ncbi:unnamed protein product [Calypogeia fissa]
MQGNWPSLPNWVFSKVVKSSSDSGQIWSNSSTYSPGPGAGSGLHGHVHSSPATSTSGQISTPVSHFHFNPSAGKAAIGGGLAAVLQAAGGLLRFLGRGGSKLERKRRTGQANSKKDVISIKAGPEFLKFGGATKFYRDHMGKGFASPGAASLLLNRVTSMLVENFSKIRSSNALPVAVAAMMPPLTNTPSNFLPFTSGEEVGSEKPCVVENLEERLRPRGKLRRTQLDDGGIVEPRTGVRFPMQLEAAANDEESSNQVLAGVGARAKTLIKLKSIMIYAFGLYVQPDQLREKIGGKYAGVPPEELKHRPEFYDDLLSHGVDMTIRLVVHYKGLKMGMVRSAFETSLTARLKKIKGYENDNGLQDFCSLMSEDVIIFRGTTIDFRWQPEGGALQTEIGGKRIGTIFSPHLCRAFFDMYIGDPPVSEPAKLAIVQYCKGFCSCEAIRG